MRGHGKRSRHRQAHQGRPHAQEGVWGKRKGRRAGRRGRRAGMAEACRDRLGGRWAGSQAVVQYLTGSAGG